MVSNGYVEERRVIDSMIYSAKTRNLSAYMLRFLTNEEFLKLYEHQSFIAI